MNKIKKWLNYTDPQDDGSTVPFSGMKRWEYIVAFLIMLASIVPFLVAVYLSK